MDPSDSFKKYLVARLGEINIMALYNDLVRGSPTTPLPMDTLIEIVQLSTFFLEVNAALFGPDVTAEMACLSQYLTVMRGEHPTRKTPITKTEALYLIAKADSLMCKRIPLSGLIRGGVPSPNTPSQFSMYT